LLIETQVWWIEPAKINKYIFNEMFQNNLNISSHYLIVNMQHMSISDLISFFISVLIPLIYYLINPFINFISLI